MTKEVRKKKHKEVSPSTLDEVLAPIPESTPPAEDTSAEGNDPAPEQDGNAPLYIAPALDAGGTDDNHPANEVQRRLNAEGIELRFHRDGDECHMAALRVVKGTTHQSTIVLLWDDAKEKYHEFIGAVLATLGKL